MLHAVIRAVIVWTRVPSLQYFDCVVTIEERSILLLTSLVNGKCRHGETEGWEGGWGGRMRGRVGRRVGRKDEREGGEEGGEEG